MSAAIFLDLIFSMLMVLAPTMVAGAALNRCRKSTSWRRALYGPMLLVSSTLAVFVLSDMLVGNAPSAVIVAACFSMPLVWCSLIWVVGAQSHPMYQMSGHGPRSLKEAAQSRMNAAHDRAHVTPAFASQRPVAPPDWGAPMPYEFLPRTEKKT